MIYGKKAPKYALKYSDRVLLFSTLTEARKAAKHRKGGKVYKVTLARKK